MAKANARTDETIDALRGRVIGNRVSIEMIAEINDQTVRAVYDNLQRHPDIPFIIVAGRRYIDPEDYARLRGRSGDEPLPPEPALEPPRRPGRPPRNQPVAAPVAPRRRAP